MAHPNKAEQLAGAGRYPARELGQRERKVLETAESFAPTTPGDWVSPPTTQDAALDELAQRTTDGPAAGSITKAQLATALQPSHVIKYAGQPTTVGGAAAEAFTVTGVAATDLAFVQVVNDGTSGVTALQAVCTTNTLTITFSANPGADTVFNYQILRATP